MQQLGIAVMLCLFLPVVWCYFLMYFVLCAALWRNKQTHTHIHTHPFNGPFPGLPRWAGTRKVKPIWILLKQETVSDSGISWAICTSAPCSKQITMPAPHHHSVFTGRMPFLPPNQQRQSTEGNKLDNKKRMRGSDRCWKRPFNEHQTSK